VSTGFCENIKIFQGAEPGDRSNVSLAAWKDFRACTLSPDSARCRRVNSSECGLVSGFTSEVPRGEADGQIRLGSLFRLEPYGTVRPT
jgi:hypothetical protein